MKIGRILRIIMNSLFFETAEEFEGFAEKTENGVKFRQYSFNKSSAMHYGVSAGNYFCASGTTKGVMKKCAEETRRLSGGAEKFLIVGIGNPNMTADALGARTAEMVKADNKIKTFVPLMESLTGISSYDAVLGILSRIKVDCVIVIDALTARRYERIGAVYQITDTGLTAGSGVGKETVPLNIETLGVKTLAVGVPTVVSALSLLNGNGGVCAKNAAKNLASYIVTPKNIDAIISRCARVISGFLTRAFQRR